MIVWWMAALLVAQEQGTAKNVHADVAIIVEMAETDLQIQESWTLVPEPGKTIPANAIKLRAPPGARMLQIDKSTTGAVANEAMSEVSLSEPLTESKQVAFFYMFPKSGSGAHLSRLVPVELQTGRVIAQDVPGLEISTSIPSQKRTRDLNGVIYVIYDFTNVPALTDLKITMTGFPSKTVWPKRFAAILAVLVFVWMIWAVKTKRAPGQIAALNTSPVSARARRDQLVKAIEVLERDFAAEKMKPKKYERRHKELMKELAVVLHELELAESASSGRSSQPSGA